MTRFPALSLSHTTAMLSEVLDMFLAVFESIAAQLPAEFIQLSIASFLAVFARFDNLVAFEDVITGWNLQSLLNASIDVCTMIRDNTAEAMDDSRAAVLHKYVCSQIHRSGRQSSFSKIPGNRKVYRAGEQCLHEAVSA